MGVPGYVLDERKDEIPEDFEHVVVWYLDIRARAQRGQHYEPIEITQVEAYARRLARAGIEMDLLDEELIYRVDAIWQEVVPEKSKSTP